MSEDKSNLPSVVPGLPEAVPKNKGGRPKGTYVHYRPEVVDEIIERMSTGSTLISICREREDGTLRVKGEFPPARMVYDWADPNDPCFHAEFSPLFARAKLEQQRCWIEQCVDIANTPMMGIEEMREHSSKSGVSIKRAMKDMLGHRSLQIHTRLQVVARLNPQLWAERLQQPALPEAPGEGAGNRVIIEGGLPDNEPPPPEGPSQPDDPGSFPPAEGA